MALADANGEVVIKTVSESIRITAPLDTAIEKANAYPNIDDMWREFLESLVVQE